MASRPDASSASSAAASGAPDNSPRSSTYCRSTSQTPDKKGSVRLTEAEVERTWIVASRISRKECMRLISRASDAAWACVAVDAELANADPLVRGGLFDKAAALYWHFTTPHEAGVAQRRSIRCCISSGHPYTPCSTGSFVVSTACKPEHGSTSCPASVPGTL
jgi:hypothetical protein